MIKSILLSLVCSLSLFSQDKDLHGSFLGLSGGANNVFQADIGLSFIQNGYAAYGLHCSADSQTAINETTETSPTTATIVKSARGMSLGPYADFGRIVVAAGVSFVTEKDEYTKQNQYGGTYTVGEENNTKMGGYAKVGWKLGHFLIYGGYNTYYKATAGVGVVF